MAKKSRCWDPDKFVTRQEEGWERRAASHCNIKG